MARCGAPVLLAVTALAAVARGGDTGRFVKADRSAAIWWEAAGAKHHVPKCAMCPGLPDPCASYFAATQAYVDALKASTDFDCAMYPVAPPPPPTPAPAGGVTLSNVAPRRDTSGAIMDAHDSKIVLQDGVYHWFAASYGDCAEPAGGSGSRHNAKVGNCGFREDHNVTLFTSTDLRTWENRGVAFAAKANLPDRSVMFAPKTVFNKQSGLWVMWFNYIVESFSNSFYGVATSGSPAGPFQLAVRNVSTLQFADNGDENIFVDDDGQAYLIYTSIAKGHGISVERMLPSYLGTLGATASSGIFGAGYSEAPAMFRRGDLYYAAFGRCCAYCRGGSAVTVYSAPSPLGPFTARTSLGDLRSQSTDVFAYVDHSGAQQHMYVGDHWQSAPDGVKGHDFTVWAPVIFSADGLGVTTAGYEANFTITVR